MKAAIKGPADPGEDYYHYHYYHYHYFYYFSHNDVMQQDESGGLFCIEDSQSAHKNPLLSDDLLRSTEFLNSVAGKMNFTQRTLGRL